MKTNKKAPGRGKPAARAARPGPAMLKPPAKRRVMLVEDHPMTREGLAAIINRQADLEICGEASSPAEAMSALASCQPDLLVTDLTMSGRSGIEFLKDVHALRPEMPMLVLSMHDETLYAERVLRAGAQGYLMKEAGSAKVLEVIRVVLSGKCYVSSQMSTRLLDVVTGRRSRGSTSPMEKLTDREFEVFKWLGSGQNTKEIAGTLHLSPNDDAARPDCLIVNGNRQSRGKGIPSVNPHDAAGSARERQWNAQPGTNLIPPPWLTIAFTGFPE